MWKHFAHLRPSQPHCPVRKHPDSLLKKFNSCNSNRGRAMASQRRRRCRASTWWATSLITSGAEKVGFKIDYPRLISPSFIFLTSHSHLKLIKKLVLIILMTTNWTALSWRCFEEFTRRLTLTMTKCRRPVRLESRCSCRATTKQRRNRGNPSCWPHTSQNSPWWHLESLRPHSCSEPEWAPRHGSAEDQEPTTTFSVGFHPVCPIQGGPGGVAPPKSLKAKRKGVSYFFKKQKKNDIYFCH